MNILEKEIEDVLFFGLKSLTIDEAIERGIPKIENFHYERQVSLCEYGIADIVGYEINYEEKTCSFHVFELKKDYIDINTFLQCLRYSRAIKLLFSEYNVSIKMFLIGKEIHLNNDFCYLPDLFNNVVLMTYSIDMFCGVIFDYRYNFTLINAPSFNKIKIGETHFIQQKEVEDAKPNT